VRQKKNEELMAAGVTLVDPATTYIDPRAEIGRDTVIHPGVVVEGPTRIGRPAKSRRTCASRTAEIGDPRQHQQFLRDRRVAHRERRSVGPFAHLRPASVVGERAKIGNFVELKKTSLGAGSKVSHLFVSRDATVGEHVNVGAGTITCNYDGEKKHQTIIEDGAFIGSDSQLVAPVRVGKGAYVAAGSSITQDVPDGSLGIARARQANVEGWVETQEGRFPQRVGRSRMCGIIGYIGSKPVVPVLLDGAAPDGSTAATTRPAWRS
jgi:bifunctional UDP-N-acetylglucosamine pyrophosphorylase/glucosamine-1-phosphate N-acetyltransferase